MTLKASLETKTICRTCAVLAYHRSPAFNLRGCGFGVNEMKNDWAPETRSLLRSLTSAGIEIRGGNNGEYGFKNKDESQMISDLTACDESNLYVSVNGKKATLFLVYGNSPGELVCDYTAIDGDETLDKVVDSHYSNWQDRKQPVTA